MKQLIIDYLPWLLSAITIWMTLLAGNLHPKAWLVGLANQALWLVWILMSGTWGLLLLNAALWIVYGRNHLKWGGDLDFSGMFTEDGAAAIAKTTMGPASPTPTLDKRLADAALLLEVAMFESQHTKYDCTQLLAGAHQINLAVLHRRPGDITDATDRMVRDLLLLP